MSDDNNDHYKEIIKYFNKEELNILGDVLNDLYESLNKQYDIFSKWEPVRVSNFFSTILTAFNLKVLRCLFRDLELSNEDKDKFTHNLHELIKVEIKKNDDEYFIEH